MADLNVLRGVMLRQGRRNDMLCFSAPLHLLPVRKAYLQIPCKR